MTHKFVEFIPPKEDLEEEVLYISLEYGTVIHKCCCGCGKEVVTPLSPTDWKLTYDGETITLFPSIGNWNFDCQSHYWIENSKVIMARQLSKSEIEKGRQYDKYSKQKYFNTKIDPTFPEIENPKEKLNWWARIEAFFK